MGKDRSQGKRKHGADSRQAVINLLLQMEPELKQLQGNIVILQALGETADLVEPLALASLAHSCEAGFDLVLELWRASLTTARL